MGRAPRRTANTLDIAQGVTVTADSGHVIITGFLENSESRRDYETIAYSMATGEQVWSADYDAGSGTDNGPRSPATSPPRVCFESS